jgi:hypothetical protein
MPLNTLTHRLFVARPEAAANTTFSDTLATAGDFANKPSGAIDILDPTYLDPTTEVEKDVAYRAITKANGIIFSFAGGNADDDAFTWKIYGWRNENGPAELVVDGTGILGSQAVVKYPHNEATATSKFWADTLVITKEYWMKEIEATADGGNSVSKVWFDTCGYRYFYVEIPTSVGDMATYWGYF